jgi:cysteine desulfurase
MIERYFDNASTTPIDPEVRQAMAPWLDQGFGNANSPHTFGTRARDAVERARGQVAELLGLAPEEIVFTSGATESNNWVLQRAGRPACSPFEHSSIWETTQALGGEVLASDGWRVAPPSRPADVVATMRVNNETGAILQPPAAPGTIALRDLTQAAGKIACPIDYDYASLSAHKIYGPQGVGALAMVGGRPLDPLLYGGEQEHGLRGGTLNVAGIIGFGAACDLAMRRMEEDATNALACRQAVLDALEGLDGWRTNDATEQSPYILSLSFVRTAGETIVIELDRLGFAISAGAACSSRSTEPSHVLAALGLEDEWLRGTARISFGRFNRPEHAFRLGQALRSTAELLNRLK